MYKLYRLMAGEILIAEYPLEIVYDDNQKGWMLPPNIYCDTEKSMHVVGLTEEELELERSTIKATTIEVTRV